MYFFTNYTDNNFNYLIFYYHNFGDFELLRVQNIQKFWIIYCADIENDGKLFFQRKNEKVGRAFRAKKVIESFVNLTFSKDIYSKPPNFTDHMNCQY